MNKELRNAKRRLKPKCMTDRQAARYVAHTHPLEQQPDEKPEDFVLRIVQAYDHSKDMTASGVPLKRYNRMMIME